MWSGPHLDSSPTTPHGATRRNVTSTIRKPLLSRNERAPMDGRAGSAEGAAAGDENHYSGQRNSNDGDQLHGVHDGVELHGHHPVAEGTAAHEVRSCAGE